MTDSLNLDTLQPFVEDALEESDTFQVTVGTNPSIALGEYLSQNPKVQRDGSTQGAVRVFDEEGNLKEERTFKRNDIEWSDYLDVPDFVQSFFPFLGDLILTYTRSRSIFDATALSDGFAKIEEGDRRVSTVVCHPEDTDRLKEGVKEDIDISDNHIWGADVKSSDEIERGEMMLLASGPGRPLANRVAILMKEDEDA